uniref:EF-hand domain-containing protein n=1 Tax=Globodera rostochiensis TaxID=31243 RepID=A0A914HK89_GLORO
MANSHQVPSFPGQQEPLQGHHQQQAHQQQQQANVASGQQQQQQQAQFGGEQVKDEGHIKEHLEGKVDPTAHMTPEQLQFHYFNMHDLDKNGRLDGIELIKAITHFHQENASPGHEGASIPPPLPNENELENMIDSILREDDFNGDGYIDYGEFLKAQKQREDQAKTQQQQTTPPPPHQ